MGLIARIRARQPGSPAGDVEGRLVWILGSPRSGSTWLLNLLARDPRAIKIDEPGIGAHLAVMVTGITGLRPEQVSPGRLRLNDVRADAPDYFFSERFADVTRPLLRELVLGRMGAQVERRARRQRVDDPLALVKEPHGSVGADILMSLLPRSRLLFLLRDGRDVIDSELDANSAGSWGAAKNPGYETADRDRAGFIRDRAHAWLCRTEAVQRAYAGHDPGLRMLARYEELLADTAGVVAAIAEWLDLELDADAIREGARAHSFEALDAERRGSGRFVRAASPGLWREHLSGTEQDLVERIIGAKLRELGYE